MKIIDVLKNKEQQKELKTNIFAAVQAAKQIEALKEQIADIRSDVKSKWGVPGGEFNAVVSSIVKQDITEQLEKLDKVLNVLEVLFGEVNIDKDDGAV